MHNNHGDSCTSHMCLSSKKEDCVKVRMHSKNAYEKGKKIGCITLHIHHLSVYNNNNITALLWGINTVSHTHTQDHLSNTSVDKLRNTILISHYLTLSYSLTQLYSSQILMLLVPVNWDT